MDPKFGRWWNTKDFTNYTSNRETAMESWDACLETYGVKEMRKALKQIRSGLGRDLLGTTALSREDMQSIAKAALASAGEAL